MSDADGDSTMHSDHSSLPSDTFDHDDESMLAAQQQHQHQHQHQHHQHHSSTPHASSTLPNAPSTPARPARAPSSELSPPNSQGPGTTSSRLAFSSSSSSRNTHNPPDSPSALLGSGASSSSGVANIAGLNVNGKRVHSSAMGAGAESDVLLTTSSGRAAGSASASGSSGGGGAGEPIGRAASGYEWDKLEDEPGFGWKNKKAVDEYHKAMEQVVDRQYMIKNRYGDPCVAAK